MANSDLPEDEANVSSGREDEDHGTVILIDELPTRRAAYYSLLGPWAAEHKLLLSQKDFEACPDSIGRQSLLILSCGTTSIRDLRLRVARLDIDMTVTPLVILSDTDGPGEVMEAIELGARAYLSTALHVDIVQKILTFVLAGGDFFPPSVLAASRNIKPYRRYTRDD